MTKRRVVIFEETEYGDLEDEMAAADIACEAAREYGDFGPLVDRLRSGKLLMGFERKLAAEIIAGGFKRPAHRVAQGNADFKAMRIALSVRCRADKGQQRKAAVQDVADEMKISTATVQKAVRAHPELLHPLWK